MCKSQRKLILKLEIIKWQADITKTGKGYSMNEI